MRAANFKVIPVGRIEGTRLTVLCFDHIGKSRVAYWRCRCDCGWVGSILGHDLRSGHTTQCRVCSRTHHAPPRSHSTRSRTYTTWQGMIRRCADPRHVSYAQYGGAGVTVCARWQGEDGFEHFIADMGQRPSRTTLGRRADLGGYEPGNCFWQTRREQEKSRKDKREWRALITPIIEAI